MSPLTAAPPDFEVLARRGIRGLRACDPGHDVVALQVTLDQARG